MSFSIEILLGFLAVIAAITVPLIIYFLQKSRKRLSYEVISNTQLVGIKSEIKDKVKILYDEKQVINVHLISIRFINNGNQPISIDDYAKPITINYNNPISVLTCEVLEQYPENLDVVIAKESRYIKIDPLLLNSNDSFVIKVLASDFSGDLIVSARIKGVKKLEVFKNSKNVPLKLIVLIYILMVVTLILDFFYANEIKASFGINTVYFPVVFMVILIFIIFFSQKLSLKLKP